MCKLLTSAFFLSSYTYAHFCSPDISPLSFSQLKYCHSFANSIFMRKRFIIQFWFVCSSPKSPHKICAVLLIPIASHFSLYFQRSIDFLSSDYVFSAPLPRALSPDNASLASLLPYLSFAPTKLSPSTPYAPPNSPDFPFLVLAFSLPA